jgi:hypothetical protein
VALCLNFGFKYDALVKERQHHLHHHHGAANASLGEQMELRV